MSYPLGSFPQYGHQERWASERRQRALTNSAATRRRQKNDALDSEIHFYEWMVDAGRTFDLNEKAFKRIDGKLNTLERTLRRGERVYWKRLGVLFREIVSESTDASLTEHLGMEITTQIRGQSDNHMAGFAKRIGDSLCFEERYGFSAANPPETTTEDYSLPAHGISSEPKAGWSMPSSEDVRAVVSAIYKFLGVLLIVAFALKADVLMTWVIMACVFLAPVWICAKFASSD